jgi:glycosyltransferase involved in cell wall biosynthesis
MTKRLLIITNMEHHYRDGVLVGHGPTVREIDHLSSLFDSVTHVGCLYNGAPPKSELPYTTNRLRFVPLVPTGGTRFVDKLKILQFAPVYIMTIIRELQNCDYVHIRCPANIPLLALLVLMFRNKLEQNRVWAKYAGNWNPTDKEPLSYTIQRWILRSGLLRGNVTVNGNWPKELPHVHEFYNPCLTQEELVTSADVAASKVLSHPVKLLYVGTLAEFKGVSRVINIARILHERGYDFTLELAGDGPSRGDYEALVDRFGLRPYITFHGSLPRHDLEGLYTKAHFLIFPTNSEGWPKVISEAIAAGVVPLSTDVSSIGQYLRRFEIGKAFLPDELDKFVDAIIWYSEHPDVWLVEAKRGVKAATHFTYDTYLNAVKHLLQI